MRRTRRIRDLADRKSLDDAYRSIHLRNIRINYSLNHEWEQLNWEIWVCVPHKLTFPRYDESAARRASARSSMAPARESISRKLRGKRRIPFSNSRERIPLLAESRARASSATRDSSITRSTKRKFCARPRPPKWLAPSDSGHHSLF